MSAGDLHPSPRERPVLFKPALVEKILAGLKTQTRRPVRDASGAFWDHAAYRPSVGPAGRIHWVPEAVGGGPQPRCPLGIPGDRLWVRETWQALVLNSNYHEMGMHEGTVEYDEWWEPVETADLERQRETNRTFSLVYRAGADEYTRMEMGEIGWRPSLHMRRWMCRLVLEVTELRIERLQAMTMADLRAEGYPPDVYRETARHAFAKSWDAAYKKKGAGWAADPWVWAATFKVVEKPEPPPVMAEADKERITEEFRGKVRQVRERGDA